MTNNSTLQIVQERGGPQLYFPGRVDFDLGIYPEAKQDPILAEKIEGCLDILNGDIRSPIPQHFCKGCCTDRAHACDRVMSAIVTLRLLPGLHGEAPSENRWGSTSMANAVQVGGIMLHRMLCEVVTRFVWQDSSVKAQPAPILAIITSR